MYLTFPSYNCMTSQSFFFFVGGTFYILKRPLQTGTYYITQTQTKTRLPTTQNKQYKAVNHTTKKKTKQQKTKSWSFSSIKLLQSMRNEKRRNFSKHNCMTSQFSYTVKERRTKYGKWMDEECVRAK